jgi:hypothetical protein
MPLGGLGETRKVYFNRSQVPVQKLSDLFIAERYSIVLSLLATVLQPSVGAVDWPQITNCLDEAITATMAR